MFISKVVLFALCIYLVNALPAKEENKKPVDPVAVEIVPVVEAAISRDHAIIEATELIRAKRHRGGFGYGKFIEVSIKTFANLCSLLKEVIQDHIIMAVDIIIIIITITDIIIIIVHIMVN